MKKLFLFLFFAFLVFNIISQSGWSWQNPISEGNSLNRISFVAHSGWTHGENGEDRKNFLKL